MIARDLTNNRGWCLGSIGRAWTQIPLAGMILQAHIELLIWQFLVPGRGICKKCISQLFLGNLQWFLNISVLFNRDKHRRSRIFILFMVLLLDVFTVPCIPRAHDQLSTHVHQIALRVKAERALALTIYTDASDLFIKLLYGWFKVSSRWSMEFELLRSLVINSKW